MASSTFRWIYNVFASSIGEIFRKFFHSRHLVNELDRNIIDTSKDDEVEITSSSSGSCRYDVFPSFSGVDVRKTFLSHLLKELDRRSINTFIDHGIERSRPIGPSLLSAIRGARISIVIFSKNYASSTWCLNELAEIHKCYGEGDQMVVPVFYDVDPSDVRKQTGTFGKFFEQTCKDKTDDVKQGWMRVLSEVASIAGEHLQNGRDEASMIEKIANDVSNKLVTTSNDFGDFVGIEAHLEAMISLLCLESKEAKMVGIYGTSGIGKSTIGRALYSQLSSSQFPHRTFGTYKTTKKDIIDMKLSWEKEFLSEILGQKDIKIERLGEVKRRLKHKKVLIVLDDVDDLELLKTLVGKTEWFGPGSRIIVITQNRQFLKAHEIDLVYEVKLPSEGLALTMLCRSAFGENSPPDGFWELAVEVAELAGYLPLGLSVLGSSLKGKDKDEWVQTMPRLRNDLDGNIKKTLRVSYDRLLYKKDRELFMCIACFFNGYRVRYVEDFLEDKVGLKVLTDKSLIRITPQGYIEMHNLLEKLGREIDRAKSKGNPGKRRYLTEVDFEDIREVFTSITGTETVIGIRFYAHYSKDLLSIDEKPFQGMRNLQYLVVNSWSNMDLPRGLVYLPRKLRLLRWSYCPLKSLPSNFMADCLVELNMFQSKLEKLWEGTLPLGSLKRMNLRYSEYLREIPDLSNAINLEELDLWLCKSLVTLPSSIQKAIKLRKLNMSDCIKLKRIPTLFNLEALEDVNLEGCSQLINFPEIKMGNSTSWPHRIEINVGDCFWNKNLPGLDYLDCLMRCMPCKFRPEYLVYLVVRGNKLEKLWEGVQSLGSLMEMDMSQCESLTEIPDLSKATNLEYLNISKCKSLVMLPSTIGNLQKLLILEMNECTKLQVLPTDVNLSSLKTFDLSGCSSLTSFPLFSRSIEWLYLENTAVEEVPCCIESFSRLTILLMYCCKRLKNISPNIFRLTSLKLLDFTECRSVNVIMALSDDTSVVATMEDHFSCVQLYEDIGYTRERVWDYGDGLDLDSEGFIFQNCLKLDRDARELISRSGFKPAAVIPGGEVPRYFQHRAYGNSLTVTLPQSSLSQEFLLLKACIVVDFQTEGEGFFPALLVNVSFNGTLYSESFFEDAELELCKTDHLFFCSVKFGWPTDLPSKLAFNYVEFEFHYPKRIKECGVRLLNVSPYPDESDGSSETESPDTCLSAPNPEVSLGQGEASSTSACAYPCLEGEALCVDSMIIEQQDEQIPIVW